MQHVHPWSSNSCTQPGVTIKFVFVALVSLFLNLIPGLPFVPIKLSIIYSYRDTFNFPRNVILPALQLGRETAKNEVLDHDLLSFLWSRSTNRLLFGLLVRFFPIDNILLPSYLVWNFQRTIKINRTEFWTKTMTVFSKNEIRWEDGI